MEKRTVLILFDDTIPDMECNKKWSLIVTELFLRGRKLIILLVFISQFHFKVSKTNTNCNTLFYHENFSQENFDK